MADLRFVPAFAPAVVLIPRVSPLGEQSIELRAMYGNVTLLDYFAGEIARDLFGSIAPTDDCLDGFLDTYTRQVWRLAESMVRTRPVQEREPQAIEAPASRLLGGAT